MFRRRDKAVTAAFEQRMYTVVGHRETESHETDLRTGWGCPGPAPPPT
jgi:hypothetical protein